MDIIFNLLKDKKSVIEFLLDTMESNSKMSKGLRALKQNNNNQFKIDKLKEMNIIQFLKWKKS